MTLKYILFLLIFASLTPLVINSLVNRRYYAPFIIILAYYNLQIPFLLNEELYFSEYEIVKSSFYVIFCNLFLTFFMIYGGAFKMPPPKFNVDEIVNKNKNKSIIYIFFILLTIYFSIEYLNNGFNRLGIWEERSISKAGFLTPIMTMTSFIIFILWTRLNNFAIMLISSPALLYIFFATGARAIFIIIFGAVWFFFIGRVGFRKLIIIGPLTAAIGLTVHIVSRAARGLTFSNLSLSDIYQAAVSTFSEGVDLTGGDGTIAEAFVFSMRIFDQKLFDIMPMTTPFRMLTFLFPSFIFEFKPQDVTYSLWQYAIQGGYFSSDEYYSVLINEYSMGQNGSLHPILWGDALLNAGWFGVLIWPLAFSITILKIERVLCRMYNTNFASLLAGAAAPALIYIVRGNVYLGSLLFLPVLFVLAICWIDDRRIFPKIRKAMLR